MRTEPISIPRDHPVFTGHFPERPLVPGSMLLELILTAWGAPVSRVPSVKFLRPVLPGDELTVRFTPVEGSSAVRFAVNRGNETVCAGALVPG